MTADQCQALAAALYRAPGTLPLADLAPRNTVFGPMLVDPVGALLRNLENPMSYDVYLEIDTGASEDEWPEIFWRNYTSNCAGMWRHALGGDVGLADFHRKSAAEAAPLLAAAAQRMRDNPAVYAEMNPPNGWGDHESAADFLASIAEACAKHPKAVIRISR